MDKTDNSVLSKYKYNEIAKNGFNKENEYKTNIKKTVEIRNKYATNYSNISNRTLPENKSEINVNKKIWEKTEVNKNIVNIKDQTKKSELNIITSKYIKPETKTEITKQENSFQKNKPAEKPLTNKFQIKKEEQPKKKIKELNITKEISNQYSEYKETPIKNITIFPK
jgi:hypothetical protein